MSLQQPYNEYSDQSCGPSESNSGLQKLVKNKLLYLADVALADANYGSLALSLVSLGMFPASMDEDNDCGQSSSKNKKPYTEGVASTETYRSVEVVSTMPMSMDESSNEPGPHAQKRVRKQKRPISGSQEPKIIPTKRYKAVSIKKAKNAFNGKSKRKMTKTKSGRPRKYTKSVIRTSAGESNKDDDEAQDREANDNVTCPCGKPYAGRPMIACDSCDVWYHISCEKVKKSSFKKKTYICKKCSVKPSSFTITDNATFIDIESGSGSCPGTQLYSENIDIFE